MPEINSKIKGTLLGTFIGDSLGRPFEGFAPTHIVDQIKNKSIAELLQIGKGRYTDDTQMTIAMAESLIENNGLDQDALIKKFVDAFEPSRGYGVSLSIVLEQVAEGVDWREANRAVFPEGSFGNGASMRIAPLACYFWNESIDAVWNKAIASSEITHAHPQGYLMAAVQAVNIHFLLNNDELNPSRINDHITYLGKKLETAQVSLCKKLEWIANNFQSHKRNSDILINLGNNVLAEESVFSSFFLFLNSYETPEKCFRRAISLGGDTDTIGAMTGALLGSFHGDSAFPQQWLDELEQGEKGLDYLVSLADKFLK